MSESEFTDLETASCCPKCNLTGTETHNRMGLRGSERGTKVHVFKCMNSRCSWYETDWIVQENPDGRIPIRQAEPRRPKEHPVDMALRDQILKRIEADYHRSLELGSRQRPTDTAT